METIKILVVDDHRLIINGIRAMLEEVDEIEIVAQASNGKEAIEVVKNNEDVQVVLMDIKMPQMNGIDATREAMKINPELKIMALTMFEDDQYITSMLQAGAIGYVLKHTSKQELIQAIKKVAEGEPYFSHDVAKIVMSRYLAQKLPLNQGDGPAAGDPATKAGAVELTDRESEILRLIAAQLTNQEIADKLFISPRTVHSHRRNLMQKIGVKNTAGLVRYAIQEGLV